jgi:hypothetical protein
MRALMISDLAILYEHPAWFAPLFAALDRRGLDYVALTPDGAFDPADPTPPAKVVFNRIAMSSFLRGGAAEHPIFYSSALLDHWRRCGATVINGPEVLAIDSSKARQLSLIVSLGLHVPATRVVHRAEDVLRAAGRLSFPLVVKANIGGSGAGITRFDNLAELRYAVSAGELPKSVDGVLLVQDYVPARGGIVTRIETLDRSYLYALDIAGAGAFDLCPADACAEERGALSLVASNPGPELCDAAERIAREIDLDLGGIEVMIDDRDGIPRFYDINALSNFVGKPLDVLGWDPHDRLVDYLVARITAAKQEVR